MAHLIIVTVYGIETHLILHTEYKYHHVYPVGKLQVKHRATLTYT